MFEVSHVTTLIFDDEREHVSRMASFLHARVLCFLPVVTFLLHAFFPMISLPTFILLRAHFLSHFGLLPKGPQHRHVTRPESPNLSEFPQSLQ